MVGDAKFETVKNKEAKESWIQEQRKKSEDEELSEEEVSWSHCTSLFCR